MYTKSNFLGNIFQYKVVSFPPKLKLISYILDFIEIENSLFNVGIFR